MAMTINTNMASLNAQRNLSKTQGLMNLSMQRLSSGLRINSAKDDAAGLGISTRFNSQIRGLNQAVRNANDGISQLQVAEGAMQEVTNILGRMRELAVQSANTSTYDDTTDRASMQDEVDQLVAEVARISSTTEFNGVNLLDGTATQLTFQVGANQGQNISVTLASITTAAGSLNIATASVGTATDAGALLTTIDAALDTVSGARGSMGAVQNRLESTMSNLMNVSENLSAANGRIVDADFAAETAALTKQQILAQAGTAMLAQAKQLPQMVLQLLQN
jgi:flagellin